MGYQNDSNFKSIFFSGSLLFQGFDMIDELENHVGIDKVQVVLDPDNSFRIVVITLTRFQFFIFMRLNMNVKIERLDIICTCLKVQIDFSFSWKIVPFLVGRLEGNERHLLSWMEITKVCFGGRNPLSPKNHSEVQFGILNKICHFLRFSALNPRGKISVKRRALYFDKQKNDRDNFSCRI